MAHIEIIYNPYRETSRILLDGHPVSEHGGLARYQTEPFYRWCGEILDAAARQLNDVYTLSFTSAMIEREILTELGKGHPDCKKVDARQCAVNVPLAKRFDALQNALGQRSSFTVYLMTPPGKEAMQGEARHFTAKSGTSGIRTMNSPYQAADIFLKLGPPPLSADPFSTLSVWLSDNFQEEYAIPDAAFMLGRTPAVLSVAFMAGQSTGFRRLNGNLYSYACEPGKLEKLLLRFLEYACVAPYFNHLYTTELNQKFPSGLPMTLFGADTIEPIVAVSVYPQNMPVPQITYRIVPDGIVFCDKTTIRGLSAGDAMIEAFVSGSPEPCSRFSVRVFRRNRINAFTLACPALEIPVGAEMEFPYQWEPGDADNADRIGWRCSPDICRVTDRGNGVAVIKGSQPGDATLTVSAESVSANIRVRVRQTIQTIHLSADWVELCIGQTAPLAYQFTPADAFKPDVAVKFSDPGVVAYQGGRLLPRRVGETEIVFQSANSSASASCKVKVGASSGTQGGTNGVMVLAILLMLISFAVQAPVSFALAAASLLFLFFGVFRQTRRFSPALIIVLAGCVISIARDIIGFF